MVVHFIITNKGQCTTFPTIVLPDVGNFCVGEESFKTDLADCINVKINLHHFRAKFVLFGRKNMETIIVYCDIYFNKLTFHIPQKVSQNIFIYCTHGRFYKTDLTF